MSAAGQTATLDAATILFPVCGFGVHANADPGEADAAAEPDADAELWTWGAPGIGTTVLLLA